MTEKVRGERQWLEGKMRGNEKGEGERQWIEGKVREAIRRERWRDNEKGERESQ